MKTTIGDMVNGVYIKGIYEYKDLICGIGAKIFIRGFDNDDTTIRTYWDKGKKPENNEQCKESINILENIIPYMDGMAKTVYEFLAGRYHEAIVGEEYPPEIGNRHVFESFGDNL